MGQQHWWDEWITAIVAFFATDLGHFLGGLVLLALGWISRNIPIHSGMGELREELQSMREHFDARLASLEARHVEELRAQQLQFAMLFEHIKAAKEEIIGPPS